MCDDVRRKLVTYITENQERLYRFAVGQTGDREDAMDILQNAIVKALENYMAIRNPEDMKTWFFRVLLNECYGYMRKEVAFELEQDIGRTKKIYESMEILEELDQAVRKALEHERGVCRDGKAASHYRRRLQSADVQKL